MNALKDISRVLLISGALFMAVFSLTRQSIIWQGFIAANIYYIVGALILTGLILKFIYLWVTKDYKKLKQEALILAVMIAMFVFFYSMK